MTAIGDLAIWPQLAGQRPSSSAVPTSMSRLHLRLFGDLQCIVDLDPKVADGAFEPMAFGT